MTEGAEPCYELAVGLAFPNMTGQVLEFDRAGLSDGTEWTVLNDVTYLPVGCTRT